MLSKLVIIASLFLQQQGGCDVRLPRDPHAAPVVADSVPGDARIRFINRSGLRLEKITFRGMDIGGLQPEAKSEFVMVGSILLREGGVPFEQLTAICDDRKLVGYVHDGFCGNETTTFLKHGDFDFDIELWEQNGNTCLFLRGVPPSR